MKLRSLISFSLIFISLSANASLNIVTSIKPLELVVKQLVASDDQVVLLAEGGRSPHHYQLSVKNRRQLEEADLVIWIGPELEVFLEKPLAQIDSEKLRFSQLAGLSWPESTHTEEADDHHDHDHGDLDPHLWLNPKNLQVMAVAVTNALKELQPKFANDYQARLEKFNKGLKVLDEKLSAELSEVKTKPFMVLHPAYDHFVDHYGLKQLDYISITPERGVGAKHLYQLRKQAPVCVFSEVGQSDKVAKMVSEATGANLAVLDPLGVNLSQEATIGDLLENLSKTIKECLLSPLSGS